MLHGDISNQVGTTIAIQCVDTLLHFQTDGTKNKLLNLFGGKERRAVWDDNVLRAMEYIYRNTDMCVDIVVFDEDYSQQLIAMLDDRVPFNRILHVTRPAQIGSRLLTGDITYYIDNNIETLSLVNSPYALPFEDFHKVVRIRGRR